MKKMRYYNILNLDKEPFSNSPDPDFFYRSKQHLTCVQQLEISLRLRRGLNVVTGDVGMGKTTICRQLIRNLGRSGATQTVVILDPDFETPHDFIKSVAEKMTGRHQKNLSLHDMKEEIKKYLLKKGTAEKKNIVLIIDEGQKMADFCLEILREFLNYETNDHKLLQIVIFAQKEFKNRLKKFAYFEDRISFYSALKPLTFKETCGLVRFRLQVASGTLKPVCSFSLPALWRIYQATDGYPRRIVNLCHQCLLAMILKNRRVADIFLVGGCLKKIYPGSINRWRQAISASFVLIFGTMILMANLAPQQLVKLFSPAREYFRLSMAGALEQKIQPRVYKGYIRPEALTSRKENRLASESGLHSPDRAAAKNPTTNREEQQIALLQNEHKRLPRYSVQAGAFLIQENADRLFKNLLKDGYPAYIFSETDSAGRLWHCVRIGKFDSVQEAANLAGRLKEQKRLSCFIFPVGSLAPVTLAGDPTLLHED